MRNRRQAALALRNSGCRQDCSGDFKMIANVNKEPSFSSVLNPPLTLAAKAAAVLKKRLVLLLPTRLQSSQ